jgi:hypothetical protein
MRLCLDRDCAQVITIRIRLCVSRKQKVQVFEFRNMAGATEVQLCIKPVPVNAKIASQKGL